MSSSSNRTVTISAEQAYANQLSFISNQIAYYYLVITTPFGLLGNAISIFIYLRPNLSRKTTTTALYMCLTILNTISILNYIFLTRSTLIFGYTINTVCGLISYVRRTIFNMTSWCQVLICLDRFIMVFYPIKHKKIHNLKFLFIQLVTIFVIILITNSTNLISSQVGTRCRMDDTVSLVTNLIAILMRVYLPFFFMTAINLAIIRKLAATRSKVSRQNHAKTTMIVTNQTLGSVQDQGAGAFTQSARQRKMTQATMIMDLIFLIFLTPIGVNLTLNIIDTYTTIFSSSVMAETINDFYIIIFKENIGFLKEKKRLLQT
jgi:hypothetical protein